MFYEKLETLCAKRGMSVTRMAKELGLSNATATKWKSGSKPFYKTLLAISKYFDVEIEYLLDDNYMDYDEWLLEVKGMTRAEIIRGEFKAKEETVPVKDGLDEEFMVLAKKLSSAQMQRVKDFMRGILS